MTNFASAVDTTSSSSEGVRPQLSLDAKAAGSSGSGASCGSKEQYSFPVLEVTDAQELAKKLVAGGPTQGGKGLVGLKGEGLRNHWHFVVEGVHIPFRTAVSWIQQEIAILLNFRKLLEELDEGERFEDPDDAAWRMIVPPGEQAEGQKYPDNKWSIDIRWFGDNAQDMDWAENRVLGLRDLGRRLKKGIQHLKQRKPYPAGSAAETLRQRLFTKITDYTVSLGAKLPLEKLMKAVGYPSEIVVVASASASQKGRGVETTYPEFGFLHVLQPHYLDSANAFAKAVLGALQPEVEGMLRTMKERLELLKEKSDNWLGGTLLETAAANKEEQKQEWRKNIVAWMTQSEEEFRGTFGVSPKSGKQVRSDLMGFKDDNEEEMRRDIDRQLAYLEEVQLMNFKEDQATGYSRNLCSPVWAGSHTDICAVTLIPAASDEGLELYVGDNSILERPDESSEHWYKIKDESIDMYLFLSDFLQANTQFDTIDMAIYSTAPGRSGRGLGKGPRGSGRGLGKGLGEAFVNDNQGIFEPSPGMGADNNLFVVVSELLRIKNANPEEGVDPNWTRANGVVPLARERLHKKISWWTGEKMDEKVRASWEESVKKKRCAESFCRKVMKRPAAPKKFLAGGGEGSSSNSEGCKNLSSTSTDSEKIELSAEDKAALDKLEKPYMEMLKRRLAWDEARWQTEIDAKSGKIKESEAQRTARHEAEGEFVAELERELQKLKGDLLA
eukprot:g11192.t1